MIERYTLAGQSIASEIGMLKANDERIFISLTQNKVVQDALSGSPQYTALLRYTQFQSVQDFLAMGVNAGGITGVYLVGDSGVSFRSADNVMDVAVLSPEIWEVISRRALENPMTSYWFVDSNNIMGSGRTNVLYLFMALAIPTRVSLKGTAGVGLIRISYDRYIDTLKYALSSKHEYAFLLDSYGQVLMHTGDRGVPGNAPEEAITEFIESGEAVLESKSHESIFLRTDVPETGWTLVHYVPYTLLNHVPPRLYQFIWMIMLISFVLMLLGLGYFARRITSPIRRLSGAMRRFGEGGHGERVSLNRGDEIGALGDHFNNMADQLTSYMRLSEENHRARTRLELSVLENQINPHFLYNTLDLIHWKATFAGNEDISVMTTYLARFFRLGLHNGQEFIPVTDEIEHARMYLAICKMRYGDAFSYEIDADPAIKDCRIKKTLLQPILENSAKYGLRKNATDNLLTVRAHPQGEWIELIVSDTGPGMDEERLENVIRCMRSSDLSAEMGSLGLHNLYARLNFAYNGRFELTIKSAPNQGVEVTIRVPREWPQPNPPEEPAV